MWARGSQDAEAQAHTPLLALAPVLVLAVPVLVLVAPLLVLVPTGPALVSPLLLPPLAPVPVWVLDVPVLLLAAGHKGYTGLKCPHCNIGRATTSQ